MTNLNKSLLAVSDRDRATRRNKIEAVANDNPIQGVLAAAMDLEWTIRRSILALTTRPTVEMKFVLKENYQCISGLHKGWNQLLKRTGIVQDDFFQILDGWAKRNGDAWLLKCDVEWAEHWRSCLIHGGRGGIPESEAKDCVNILETAADIIEAYARKHGSNIFEPIVRRGKWNPWNLSKYLKQKHQTRPKARPSEEIVEGVRHRKGWQKQPSKSPSLK